MFLEKKSYSGVFVLKVYHKGGSEVFKDSGEN